MCRLAMCNPGNDNGNCIGNGKSQFAHSGAAKDSDMLSVYLSLCVSLSVCGSVYMHVCACRWLPQNDNSAHAVVVSTLVCPGL